MRTIFELGFFGLISTVFAVTSEDTLQVKYLWRNGRVLNEKSRFRLRFLSLHSGATITLKSSCAICPDGLVQIKSTIFGRSQRLDIFDEQGMSVAENTLQRDLFDTLDNNSSSGFHLDLLFGKDGDYFRVVINDKEAGVVKVQFPVLTLREITAIADDDSDVVNIFYIKNQPQISAKHIFLENWDILPAIGQCGLNFIDEEEIALISASPVHMDALPSRAEIECRQKTQTPVENRIVNGHDELQRLSPWIVSLRYKDIAEERAHFCGGSIIGKRWIVTAAHCITDTSLFNFNFQSFHHDKAGYLKNYVEKIFVRIGTHLGYGQKNPYSSVFDGAKALNISDVVVKPEFCGWKASTSNVNRCMQRSRADDIALIRLAEDINFDKNTQPICLSRTHKSAVFPAGSCCTIVGWGLTGNTNARPGSAAKMLQKASIPIQSEKLCQRLPGWTEKGMVCAGLGAQDTCSGDSGGPLSCSAFISANSTTRTWFLRGVTSFGDAHCGSGNPAAYADVEEYTSWIADEIYRVENEKMEEYDY